LAALAASAQRVAALRPAEPAVLDAAAVRLPAEHGGVAPREAPGGLAALRLAAERVAAVPPQAGRVVAAVPRPVAERVAGVALRPAEAERAGAGAPLQAGRVAAVVPRPEARGGLVQRPEGQAAQAPPSAAAWVFRRDQALPWPVLPAAAPSGRAKES
jgi:hypothetical protein